ncbi:Tetrin c [Trichuris trichiura]|uniref:Tetrin c n=1 Tax=Trichuris trichiura TaxID=36087 RepID=A0A077ZHR7_TRITR|nr:Tetrin c [Trichuris trichiura]
MSDYPKLVELSAVCSCQEDLIVKLELQVQSYRRFTQKLRDRLREHLEDEGQLFRCLEAAQLASESFKVDDNAILEKAEVLCSKLILTASKLETLTEKQEKYASDQNSVDPLRLANIAQKYWDSKREIDSKAEEYKKNFEKRCLQADQLRKAEVNLYKDQLKQVNENLTKALRDIEDLNERNDQYEDQLKALSNIFKDREALLESDVTKYQTESVSAKLENNRLKCSLESIKNNLKRTEEMRDVEVTSLKENLELIKHQHHETHSNLITVKQEVLNYQQKLGAAERELQTFRYKQRAVEEDLRQSVTELKQQLVQCKSFYQQEKDMEISKLKRLLHAQNMIIAQLKTESMKVMNKSKRTGKKQA